MEKELMRNGSIIRIVLVVLVNTGWTMIGIGRTDQGRRPGGSHDPVRRDTERETARMSG